MSDLPPMPETVYFAHEAMNTTFHLRIPPGDPLHRRSVSRLCFEELDRLEGHLSRFIEGSDISQINAMQAGDRLFVSEACHACLIEALRMYQETGGLFDVTLGRRIEHLKSGEEGTPPAVEGHLMVDPERPLIVCEQPGRQIDLGGIGKGYALDCLREILIEWGIDSGLISAGASTQLAFGPPGWPIELAGDGERITLPLENEALSVSGTGVQGSHIVHPDGGEVGPGLAYKRLWLTAPTAARADAWSTAILLMTDEQIDELGTDRPQRLFVEDASGIRPWRPPSNPT
jgi:thiamine biosynthesis lipoprotein